MTIARHILECFSWFFSDNTFKGAALTSGETQQLQEVFEETKIPVRLRLTLELLKKELAVCLLQQQLGKEVRIN